MEFRYLEERIKKLARDIKKDSEKSNEMTYTFRPLGIHVACDERRNFIFANRSAKAVFYLKSLGRKVNFIDLGSGSGINCLAAKIAGAEKVTGIEYDEQTYDYANGLMKKIGIKYNLVFGDFLKKDFQEERFDIVVNENLYPMLADEPQLRAAKYIRPNTFSGTIFIPNEIKFKLVYQQQEREFEGIRFDGNYGDEIVRSVEFNYDGSGLAAEIYAKLIDSFGKTMVDYSEELQGIPLGKPKGMIIIPRRDLIKLSWNTSRAQELTEILEQSFEVRD